MDILDNENFDLLLKAATISLPTKIHKSLRMVESGALSKEAATQVFAHLASERYPGDKLGLSKFLADGDGARLMNAMVVAERTAKSEPPTRGHNDQSDNPANRNRSAKKPKVEDADEEVETEEGTADKATGSAEISSAAPTSAKPERYDARGKKPGKRKPDHRQSVDPNDQDRSDEDSDDFTDTAKSRSSAAADYCHSLALEHSAREGCSLDKSYGALLSGDRFFQCIWKLASKPLSA